METKTYELSISENYVHTWGIEEAIREIMQNAIDSEADGNILEISYNSGVLAITNFGVNLEPSSLVLGNTGKADGNYVGKFGEGLKLAVLVLLREGLEIEILTNGEKWIPEFRESKVFFVETLHFDIEVTEGSSDEITIKIKGLPYDTFKDIRSRSLAMLKNMEFNIGDIEESEYGEILLNKEYKGMMFVEGLFIQEDSTFNYGYNFKKEYVQLDRDRKAINYYELKELTVKALTSQKNIEIVQKSLSGSHVDTSNLENIIDDITDEFSVNFAHEFMERNNIDEETFVGPEKLISISGKEKTFKASKAVSKLVAKGLGKEDEYSELEAKIEQLNEKELGHERYKNSKFKELIEFTKTNCVLNDEQIEEFIKIVSHYSLTTSYFSYISDDIFDEFRSHYSNDESEDE